MSEIGPPCPLCGHGRPSTQNERDTTLRRLAGAIYVFLARMGGQATVTEQEIKAVKCEFVMGYKMLDDQTVMQMGLVSRHRVAEHPDIRLHHVD